jgi:hypothetical protein
MGHAGDFSTLKIEHLGDVPSLKIGLLGDFPCLSTYRAPGGLSLS